MKEGYIFIHRSIFDLNLTPRQFHLLLFCLLSMDKNGRFSNTYEGVALKTGVSVQDVIEDLAVLTPFIWVSSELDKYGNHEFQISSYQSFFKQED